MALDDKELSVDWIDHVEASPNRTPIVNKEHEAPVTPQSKSKQERRLVLKQDLTITLVLAGCYFWAYLDRGNIGNARVMGFQKDLHLSDDQFFNTLMMFFVGYMVFELPAALSLRYLHPGWAYGCAVVGFGVFSTCLASARSYAAAMVLRLLLGASEAYVQTGLVYLALWYTPQEMGMRNAMFFGLAPLAGMISGIIAFGCEKNLDGVAGFTSWQWLYIIEGTPAIAWGILTAICVPSLPEQVPERGHWLFRDKEEHSLILARSAQGHNTSEAKAKFWQVRWALKDVKTYLGAFGIVAPVLNIATFGNFLPTFIHEFGFSPLQTQLYVMIPYTFATFFCPIAGYLSDRFQRRALPTCICIPASIIGYIILLSTANSTVQMVGCCFVASGAYSGLVLVAAFIVINHAGYTKRASALAMAQILAQLASIMSTQIYTQPPHFYMGNGIILGFNVLGFACVVTMYLVMKKANGRREALAVATGGVECVEGSEKSYEELCDYHPLFRYSL